MAQLSDDEQRLLALKVRGDYEMLGVTGTRVYRTKSHNVLVVIEEIQSSLNASAQSRTASMKASRDMVEFLKGAKNKSVSVYETSSSESESFEKKQKDETKMEDQLVNSEITSSVRENSSSSTSETLTDKVIQSAMGKVDGMQALMKFSNASGIPVYCYYILLSKSSAKKKH